MTLSQIKQLIQSYGISRVRAMYDFNCKDFQGIEYDLDLWKEMSLAEKMESMQQFDIMFPTGFDERPYPKFINHIGNFFDYETTNISRQT